EKNLTPQRMVEVLEESIAKAAAPAEGAAAVVETSAPAAAGTEATAPTEKTAAEVAAESAAAAQTAAVSPPTEKTLKVLVVKGEELKKGMYSLRSFAELLSTIACLATDAAWE